MHDVRPKFVDDVFKKTAPKETTSEESGPGQAVREHGAGDQALFLTLRYKENRKSQFFQWMTCSVGEWTAAEGNKPERMELYFGTVGGPVIVTVQGFYLQMLVAEITEGKRKVIEQHDKLKADSLREENADAPKDKKKHIVLSIQIEPSIEQMRAAVKEAISELGQPSERTGNPRGR